MPEACADGQMHGKTSSVLLVDDEPASVEPLSLLLRHEGHRVEVVGSAEDALATIERTRPEVIITDLRLPGMDGAALARALRERLPRPPTIVALTGDPSCEVGHAGGVFDYVLHKPVDLARLRALL